VLAGGGRDLVVVQSGCKFRQGLGDFARHGISLGRNRSWSWENRVGAHHKARAGKKETENRWLERLYAAASFPDGLACTYFAV
jgi:hypothetical protein